MEKTQTVIKTANKKKRIIAIIALVLILAVFATVYFITGKQLLEFFSNPAKVNEWLCGFGVQGRIIFVLVRAFQVVVKIIPAKPLEIGAGYTFGTWGGFLYCMLGTVLGSFVIILLSKAFGAKLLNMFVPDKKMNGFMFMRNKKNLSAALFIMYLIPGTPKDLFTYTAPFLPMKTSRFLLITSIARIPSILMSTWSGERLAGGNYITAAVIFIAMFLIGGIYALIQIKRGIAETD